MRIFVTGATGFVGGNVARDLAALGHAVVPGRRPSLTLEAPTIPEAVDAVVHCAAIASVAACDADPARAESINVTGSRTLAEEAARRGIPLVLTSTDLVFDGGAAPYGEDAPTSAPTLYGQTKARAERAVLDADPGHVVLRLALVVGAHDGAPGGFLAWLVDALRTRRPTALYTNQVRAPLFVGDVAPVAHAAVTRRLAGGVYHLASERGVTREDVGRAVARAFALPDDAIVPTALDRGPTLPALDDCTLDASKVRRALGIAFTPLDQALARVRAALSG